MKSLLFFLYSVAAATGLYAQTNQPSGRPDFSGTWTLKDSEYVAGPKYVNAISKALTVSQTFDSIVIESVNMNVEGTEVKNRQAISLSGKTSTHMSMTSQRKYVRSAAWSDDGKVLTFTTVFYLAGNDTEVDFTRVETWKLEDGNLKLHKKSIETWSETWEVKASYVKS